MLKLTKKSRRKMSGMKKKVKNGQVTGQITITNPEDFRAKNMEKWIR